MVVKSRLNLRGLLEYWHRCLSGYRVAQKSLGNDGHIRSSVALYCQQRTLFPDTLTEKELRKISKNGVIEHEGKCKL